MNSSTIFSSTITSSGAKRRSRASPDQLLILEKTFVYNKSPNAKIREELSKKLGMTERSIQIWFQNKRAKVKLRQRNSITEDLLTPSEYLKATTPLSSIPTNNETGNSDVDPLAFPSLPPTSSSLSSLDILGTCLLPVESLSIGTWRRVSYGPMHLVCSYSLVNRLFTWTLSDQDHVFKIEVSFSSLSQLILHLSEPGGEIHFLLNQPPTFWMQVDPGNGTKLWTQCRDFTEQRQAETVSIHTLKGETLSLKPHFMAILQTDSTLRTLASFEETKHPMVQKLKTRPRRSASAPLLPDFRLQQMSLAPFQNPNFQPIIHTLPPPLQMMASPLSFPLPTSDPPVLSFSSLAASPTVLDLPTPNTDLSRFQNLLDSSYLTSLHPTTAPPSLHTSPPNPSSTLLYPSSDILQ